MWVMARARSRRRWLVLVPVLSALALAISSSPVRAGAASSPGSSSWVRDTVQQLNIFLPDGDSDYFINGWGTDNGARTTVSGRVPVARYWSFTAYPLTSGPPVAHVHDTDVVQNHGRYRVTFASSCTGVAGTCVATAPTGTDGLLVMRLYVPVDYNGAGSGGVPLPSITYASATGAPISLSAAAGSANPANDVALLHAAHGKLAAVLTRAYPTAKPVPTPVEIPKPVNTITGPRGPYANPDNVYDHVDLNSRRGNLVLRAAAPTYVTSNRHAANSEARKVGARSQVRYWSLCVTLTGRHTGDCLRDEQIHVAKNGHFTVIVSPTCPVKGYANCLVAGPEAIQNNVAYRNLLPSASFAPHAFRGPYALTATYVARPGR